MPLYQDLSHFHTQELTRPSRFPLESRHSAYICGAQAAQVAVVEAKEAQEHMSKALSL
jgi:hypothetical protein